MSNRIKFPAWINQEIAVVAAARVRNQRQDSRAVIEYRERLLADPRMKKIWKLLSDNKNEKLRKSNIERFIDFAPSFLEEGNRLILTEGKKRKVENLEESLRLLRPLKRKFNLLCAEDSAANKSLKAFDEILPRIIALLEKKLKAANAETVSIPAIVFGEEFAGLEKIKYQGAKHFDETFTFIALSIDFRKYFGQNHSSLIGETVMVMKNISKDSYDRESLRSRVDKTIKNFAKINQSK